MTDIMVCKKCHIKPYFSYGSGFDENSSFDMTEIKCPECGAEVRMFVPQSNPKVVAEAAIAEWNKKYGLKFKKTKKCDSCDSFVDVGYKCAKKCLKNGNCDSE